MFGLFNKKTYQPSVTPEDKDWIEKNITWFIEVFGIDKLKEQPLFYQQPEIFHMIISKTLSSFKNFLNSFVSTGT